MQCRGENAQRAHQLQYAGVKTAPVERGMFGEIDRRAANFAAYGKPLQQAQQQQQDGRQHAGLRIGWQQSYCKCRAAHQHDGCDEDWTPSVLVS